MIELADQQPDFSWLNGKPVEELRKTVKLFAQLLAKENCTLRDAEYILHQTESYIHAAADVQFKGMPDHPI